MAPSGTAAQYRFPADNTDACPAGFSVARRSVTDLLETDSAARRADAQVIEVTLQPFRDRQIRSAEIVVHAYTGDATLLPLQHSDSHPSTTDRSFHLETRKAGDLRRTVVLERVNGIESVDLIALHFADGRSWNAEFSASCRAVPSLYLAVGAK